MRHSVEKWLNFQRELAAECVTLRCAITLASVTLDYVVFVTPDEKRIFEPVMRAQQSSRRWAFEQRYVENDSYDDQLTILVERSPDPSREVFSSQSRVFFMRAEHCGPGVTAMIYFYILDEAKCTAEEASLHPRSK